MVYFEGVAELFRVLVQDRCSGLVDNNGVMDAAVSHGCPVHSSRMVARPHMTTISTTIINSARVGDFGFMNIVILSRC